MGWIEKHRIRIWWFIILIVGIYYVLSAKMSIFNEPSITETLILVCLIIIIFLPFSNEVRIFGVSIKKQLNETKRDFREEIRAFKTEIFQNMNLSNKIYNITQVQENLPSYKKVEVEQEGTDDKEFDQLIKSYIPQSNQVSFSVRYILEDLLISISAKFLGKNDRRLSKISSELGIYGILDSTIQEDLNDIFAICNRGIHGEILDERYITYLKVKAPSLIKTLEEISLKDKDSHFTCPVCGWCGFIKENHKCPSCGLVK